MTSTTTAPVLNTVPPGERVALTNEKVTGPPAAEMLRYSKITDYQGGIEVLDNATGAGVLVEKLLGLMEPKSVVAGDVSDDMLSYASNKNFPGNVTVTKVDQQAIPMPDEGFTHVFSNFGIFFCQDDSKALSETYRVLKSGGLAGFTSWKSIAWWSEIAQPAIAQYLPDAPELPKPDTLFPGRGWSDPEAIPKRLEEAGFTEVDVSEYSFTPDIEPEAFAEATGVLVKIVAKRQWPEDVFTKHAAEIEGALLRYLKERYEGGRWTGKMTAIISLGNKP